MAEEEGKAMEWPGGADEATDFDYLMVGKNNKPIMKIPKEKLNEVIVINGEGVKAVAGGATEATAVVLAPGPSGQNRKMEDVVGWFVNGTAANPPVATGTPWQAPAGNKNTNWWDGTTWSLGSSVALPTSPVADEVIAGGTEAVSQNGVFKYSATKEDVAESIVGVRINKFDKSSADIALGYNITPGGGTLFVNSGTNVSPFLKVKGNTQYAVSSRSHLAWFDKDKVYISGINYSTDPALTFISPINAAYVRYGYLQSFNVNNMMFVEGSAVPSTYVPYSKQQLPGDVEVGIANLPATLAKKGEILQPDLQFAENITGTNLFDKNDTDVTIGKYVHPTTGVLSTNASYIASGYIPVVGDTTYYFSYKSFMAWYDKNKVFISGSTNTDTNKLQVSPTNARFVRTSITPITSVDNVYVNKDSDKGFAEYSKYYLLKNVKAEIESAGSDEVLLFIPDTLYVAQGRTIELYYNQILWCGNINNYHFFFTGLGMTMKRKWSITGTSGNLGTYTVTCQVYDNNMDLVASKPFTVKIVSNVITTPFSVVPIGDSLTNAKPWIKEIVDNLSATKISFTGTRFNGTSGVNAHRHEGRSGASPNYYIGNNSYTFDANGDAGIDGRTQDLNPFWNPVSSAIDWNYYKSNYSKNPDKILIFLGTNGIALDPTIAVSRIKTFIDGLRSSGASTVPVYIVFTLFRSNQDGIAKQTGNDGFSASTAWKLQEDRKIFNLAVALNDEFKLYTNLHYVPIAQCHDSEYNYGAVATPVNPRASQTVDMPIESIHPQTQGYMQFADIMFSVFAGTQ